MKIQINTDDNIKGGAALAQQTEAVVESTLAAVAGPAVNAPVPVVAGGQIVGLLTLENISGMMMVNAAMDHHGAAHSKLPKLSTQHL